MRLVISGVEYIKDWYLTRTTGKDKGTRDWEAWYYSNVNYRARDITDMFKNFKHIIVVNPEKFLDMHDPFSWVPNADARQYFWPDRMLGSNAVWRFERVNYSNCTNRWYLNDICGIDMVFVATNNDDDAIMISLKFS